MEKLYLQNGNILYILNVLKKYSDEDHILSAEKIKNYIYDEYEVNIDVRTIRRNIRLLIDKFEYDISTRSDNNKGYYYIRDVDKDFELGEIRTIIDTISFANYITPKTSRSIINKCLNMLNIYEEETFDDYKLYYDNSKTSNIAVIKNIEDINQAIHKKKKIVFDYNKYDIINNKLEIVPIHKEVIVSPYNIFYSMQEFYLICLADGKDKLYTYRIDRMSNLSILKKDRSDEYNEKDIKEFIKSCVSMYAGKSTAITFRFKKGLLDTVIESFGKDITFKLVDKDVYKTTVNVNKEGFKYFAIRNIEQVKVIEPLSLKNEINDILKNNII